MSIKSIRFQGTIKSSGIVNFDGKDAKWLLKKAKPDCRAQLSHDNAKVAKHAFTQIGVDEKGEPILNAVLKISKDCIRQAIFKEDQPFHNPAIVHAEKKLIELLASVAGLLRGYMFAGICKKKSPVYISDAVQISNNVSTFDIGTQNAPKTQKESAEDASGLSMHFKESIGGLVTYEFEGAVDLSGLQFISLSEMYDRLAVNPNYTEAYIKSLEATLGSSVKGKAFYIKKTAAGGLPEEGITLTSDQVKVLVESFFKRFFDLEIIRGASGRAWLDTLKIMPKESGLDNKNWIEVKDASEVVKAIDEVHTFYDEYNEEEAVKIYDTLKNGEQKQADVKAAKKAATKKVKQVQDTSV